MHGAKWIAGLVLATAVAGTLFAADAASQERRGPARTPASIQLTPDPLAIRCDGVDSSTITVRVTDVRGRAVPDGTTVHFDVRFGFADPVEVSTLRGEASTELRLYPSALQFPRNTGVFVFVGDLRAAIGVDCISPVPCNPFSPPAHPMSPPCEPLPCSNTDSPPVGQSPPCPRPTPCAPASPPCGADNRIELDADPSYSGIQNATTQYVGSWFSVDVTVTALASPFDAYQWAIEWPTAGLEFVGSVTEFGPRYGLVVCTHSPRPPVTDAAYDEAHWGRCYSEDGTTVTSLVRLTSFEMSCASPGAYKLNLIRNAEDGTPLTTLFSSGDALATSGEGLIVFCNVAPCEPTFSPPCTTPTPQPCGPPVSPPCGTPTPEPPVTLALDADITNGSGPCTQIDDVASLSVGQQLQVGVCLLNPNATVPLTAFQYRVTYDDRIVVAPEVANSGTGLDDNPDANEGVTTFTSPAYPTSLGPVWDCHGGVGAYPVANSDGTPLDGIGLAYSGGCSSVPIRSSTLIQGPLGVIMFDAMASGWTSLTLLQVSLTDDDLVEVGTCEPVVDRPAQCLGATIVVTGGTPRASSTPTPSPFTPVSSAATPSNRPRGSRALD